MSQQDSNQLDLRRFTRSVKRLKWIYLASFIFFMGLAITYCCIKQPQYVVKSTMLIEDNTDDGSGILAAAGGMASMMKTFNIGGFGASKVDNEILLVNAHDVLLDAAKDIKLNRTYYLRDGLGKVYLTPETTPILVEGNEEMFDTLSKVLKMRVKLNKGKADITVKRGLLGTVVGKADNVTLPATVNTPYGDLTVLPTNVRSSEPQTIDVTVTGYEHQADFLETEVMVDISGSLTDGISFELLYPNRERGKAILNALMRNYNQKRLNHKHETAAMELAFIDGRIGSVLDSLRYTENQIKEFKLANNFTNYAGEADILAQTTILTETELAKARAEADYYKTVLKTLNNDSETYEVLPVFNVDGYPMIKDYNDLVIAIRDLERSATKDNPLLISSRENLASLRESVIKNIEGLLSAANAIIDTQTSLSQQVSSRRNSYPVIENQLITLERNRNMIGSLYMFLLDKRESAMLQLSSTNDLGFVVDTAYTALKPSKSKALLVLCIGFVLALLCPSFLAYIITIRNKKIYSAIDVASIGLENDTVAEADTSYGLSRLRALIQQHEAARHLYIANLTGTPADVAAGIAEKLTFIGEKVKLISGLTTNDEIASVKLANEMASAPDAYFVIDVPSADKLSLISAQLQMPEAILIDVVKAGETTTTALDEGLSCKPTATLIAIV